MWIGPSLAMTGACSDKQGAWEFMRTILTEDNQRAHASLFPFPINKTVFYEMAEDAKTPEYEETPDGERVEVAKETFLWYDDTSVEIYALTEDEVNQVIELIDTASYLLEHDRVIMDIVSEVTAGFFNGFYNAEAAADIIQSRAQIYLSEQG